MSIFQYVKRKVVISLVGTTLKVSGAALGWIIGGIIGKLLFYLLVDNVETPFICRLSHLEPPCVLKPGHYYRIFQILDWGFALIFSMWYSAKFFNIQEKYYWLRELKRLHLYIFYQYLEYSRQFSSRYTDMLWALSYITSQDFIPDGIVFVSFGTFYKLTLFWIRDWDFSDPTAKGWIALVVALLGSLWIASIVSNFLKYLLHPDRLEREIEEAPMIKAVLEQYRQEQLLKGNDAGYEITGKILKNL